MRSTEEKLSLLWIFALLNYLYCDLVGLMDSDRLGQYLTGEVEGLQISRGFLPEVAATVAIIRYAWTWRSPSSAEPAPASGNVR